MAREADDVAGFASMAAPRERLLDEIRRSRSPLLVLSGDSGIGKSSLLEAATATHTGPAAATAVRLSQPAPHAVLTALAQCTLKVAAATDGGAVLRALMRAAGTMARKTVSAVPTSATRLFFSLLEANAGSAVRATVETYAQEFRQAMPASVLQEAEAAAEPLAVDSVTGIVRRVLDFVDLEEVIAIGLDGAERFPEEQLRFLADLAEASPDRFVIRLAFRTALRDEVARLQWLQKACPGCSVIEIPVLSEEEVRGWLTSAGVDPSAARAAHRSSGGYPLHLTDLVPCFYPGEPASAAPRQEQFANLTKLAWAGLDPATRRVAARIVVLHDPLPHNDLMGLAKVGDDQWISLTEELEQTRLFSIRVDGQPWFHEQRREAILEALSDEECERNHAAAARHLERLIPDEGDHALLMELALQVRSTSAFSSDPVISTLFRLEAKEAAVLASVLELVEPAAGGAVGAAEVLMHWEDRWRDGGDAETTLEELAEKGIVDVVSSVDGPVVVVGRPRLWYLTAAGICKMKLSRPVIRSISSYLFKAVVAPVAGPYADVRYGVGRPSYAYLARLTREFERGASAVATRLSYGSTPFYACASYVSAEARDAAVRKLPDVDGRRFEGDQARFGDVLALPRGRLRTKAFLKALERLRPSRSWDGGASTTADTGRWLEHRARAIEVFASAADEAEALASEAVGGARFVWGHNADHYVELEMRGPGPSVEQIPSSYLRSLRGLGLFAAAPPTFLNRLQAEFGGRGSVLRRVSVGRRPDLGTDPFRYEFEALVSQIRTFNKSQERHRVAVDAKFLAKAVTAAVEAQWNLAIRLRNAFRAHGVVMAALEPRRYSVLVVLDAPMDSWVAGAHAWIRGDVAPESGQRDTVDLEFVQGVARDDGRGVRFNLPEGFADPAVWGEGFGFESVLDYGLAELFGQDEDDFRTYWPE